LLHFERLFFGCIQKGFSDELLLFIHIGRPPILGQLVFLGKYKLQIFQLLYVALAERDSDSFRLQKVNCLQQPPLIFIHDKSSQDGQAPIVPVTAVHETTHAILLRLLYKLFHLFQPLQLLIENLLVPIVVNFEFDVPDALRFEEIGSLCGAVDDVGELIDDEELQVLSNALNTIATILLPR